MEKGERVLVTTLTKRTAEDLADYLRDVGLKVRYLHSDIDAIERVEILRGLRAAEFDILVGINLLREGLDLPEVSLVCILDADKEGFLRSQTSLIQTAGRAARHINGEVVLFADTITQSMEALISISEYRRAKQMEYNEKHGITPQTVRRAVQESLHTILRGREIEASVIRETGGDFNLTELLRELEQEMQEASANLEFERAALLRDQIMEVKSGIRAGEDRTEAPTRKILAQQRPPSLARVGGTRCPQRVASGGLPPDIRAFGALICHRLEDKTIHLVDFRRTCEKSPMPKTKTKSETANIYAVVGSDEAEVKHAAAELAQKLVPDDAGDFGLEVIDGVADNADQAAARIRSAIEALQTLPFFGSTKVVWLKNANFLGDDVKARSDGGAIRAGRIVCADR